MSNPSDQDEPPPEYEAAFAELQERAARGELTLAQARREILALRDHFCVEPAVAMRWAAQARAPNKF